MIKMLQYIFRFVFVLIEFECQKIGTNAFNFMSKYNLYCYQHFNKEQKITNVSLQLQET